MNKEYLRKNCESVKKFLEKMLWEYQFDEMLNLYEFDVLVDELDTALHYKIEIYQNYMAITVLLPMKKYDMLKKNDFFSMYELANSINSELNIGSFYIDPLENSICYKIVHSTEKRLFDKEDIERDVYYSASKVKHYALGFELVDSGISSSEALCVCRSKLINKVCHILLRDDAIVV